MIGCLQSRVKQPVSVTEKLEHPYFIFQKQATISIICVLYDRYEQCSNYKVNWHICSYMNKPTDVAFFQV